MLEIIKNIKRKELFLFIALLFGLELSSFLVITNPLALQISFAVLVLAFLLISIIKPKLALLVVLLELVIGSKGYLFFWPLANGGLFPLRIAIWSILIISFFVHALVNLIKSRAKFTKFLAWSDFRFKQAYIALALVLGLGIISAFIYGNNLSDIYSDFNNWLYLLIIFPLLAWLPRKDTLGKVLLLAVIWLSLKTILLFIIFSHNLLAPPVYNWLRTSLVGEMTVFANNWSRVFIQSQSFIVIAFLYLLALTRDFNWRRELKNNYHLLILGALFLASIIISMSRSFWLGLSVAIVAFLSYQLTVKFKYFKSSLVFLTTTTISALALILLSLPIGSGVSLDQQLVQRLSADSEEAAIASRWSLLGPLLTEIKANPITGQGFGALVSYRSSDPRVLESNPDGNYTTYAFEWGYLDLILKIGVLGLVVYLYLLYLLIKTSYQQYLAKLEPIHLGTILALTFLIVVHFFTPYLNHPLGLGVIALCSCLISRNDVY